MPNEIVVTISLPLWMLNRLKESVEGCDYCYLCDLHPGSRHHGHDARCPLYQKPETADDK